MSDDGGFDELLEVWFSRASSSRTSAADSATRASAIPIKPTPSRTVVAAINPFDPGEHIPWRYGHTGIDFLILNAVMARTPLLQRHMVASIGRLSKFTQPDRRMAA